MMTLNATTKLSHCASERLQAAAAIDPRTLTLSALAQRSAAESEHFYRGRPHDTRFAYELFRRALTERDEHAWEYVFLHYAPLVESWVRRSGAFAGCGESSEFFVGAAFTKFWRAMSPERFATFPTLAALLHYLQLCTSSVVIDSVRTQSWAEMVSDDDLPPGQTPQVSPDEQALERVERGEFWREIEGLLNDDAERAVVIGSFVLGLKPGEIYDRRPDLFGCINDVYNVKRNVLSRLSRNTTLRGLSGYAA
ncbi:MAG TPA: sigma-70 family RNA polymerase sigma factor [Kouleothrix sp.]|uniref:RNA polymerase sigma factor n=1 Tax=Kouleothrix sp. TaxID=2779161 RepID=UPI002B75F4C9|nr:sigma-70 family RNA polymerase sigma factor [Kouleothrix sp.]HRC74741.1 sigma-70 family RNA polymerase sigma factor [Kouleothrix sp.]